MSLSILAAATHALLESPCPYFSISNSLLILIALNQDVSPHRAEKEKLMESSAPSYLGSVSEYSAKAAVLDCSLVSVKEALAFWFLDLKTSLIIWTLMLGYTDGVFTFVIARVPDSRGMWQ